MQKVLISDFNFKSSSCGFDFIVFCPPPNVCVWEGVLGGGGGAFYRLFSFKEENCCSMGSLLYISGIIHMRVRRGLAEILF